jgi:hypothetical protein
MADKKGPLTQQHIDKVLEGHRLCGEWDEYLKKLEAIGIDTSKWREDHAGYSAMFSGIKTAFIDPVLE